MISGSSHARPSSSHSASSTDSFLASARASLRPTSLPIEAPINPIYAPGTERTKRTGKPTVGVPSDKMAAFLTEIKSARLRRTGSANTLNGDQSRANLSMNGSFSSGSGNNSLTSSIASGSGSGSSRNDRPSRPPPSSSADTSTTNGSSGSTGEGPSLLNISISKGNKGPPRRVQSDLGDQSVSFAANSSMRRDILRDLAKKKQAERSMSFDSANLDISVSAGVGGKRKRGVGEGEFQVPDLPAKRRAMEQSPTSSSSSVSTSQSSQSSSIILPDSLTSANPSYASAFTYTRTRQWRTNHTIGSGTDITTPSLCSDNEGEGEGEAGEDKLLATPTGSDTRDERRRELREEQVGKGEATERSRSPVPRKAPTADTEAPQPPPQAAKQPKPSLQTRAVPTISTSISTAKTNGDSNQSSATTTTTTTANLFTNPKRIPSSPLPAHANPRKPQPPRSKAKSKAKITKPKIVVKAKAKQPVVEDEFDQQQEGGDPLDLSGSPPPASSATLNGSRPPSRAGQQNGQEEARRSRIPRKANGKLPTKDKETAKPSKVPVPRAQPEPSQSRQDPNHNAEAGDGDQQGSFRLSEPPPPSTHHIKRRRTLDEELRRAGDHLWDQDDEGGDMENGMFVALGTQKRKGFLKGGGAAGVPVYMGVGYVEGAEDDDEP
ncbi:hypothetical protein K474DRAFT_1668391 [Panus rudis PR-1116 ss-1]|nr:hypothetical protein K474DRAFT_1668391 [Panus rudis PR-1116 ss-1]